MKCRLFLMISAILMLSVLVVIPHNVLAITGVCSDCHTMHNSQGGELFEGSEQPNDQLLIRSGCLGCHGDTGSGITSLRREDGTPLVYASSSNCLAGGNFKWIEDGGNPDGNRRGHNVDVDPINESHKSDDLINTDVPGFDGVWGLGSNRLTCAGSYGCHGKPSKKGDGVTIYDNWAGIKGAHHSNKRGQITFSDLDMGDPNDVGGSYRFLLGIAGYEDPNYEEFVSETRHNVYKGANISTPSDEAESTISALCARCHGYFHYDGDIGGRPGTVNTTGSPWLRHPTDIDLPPGEYQDYGGTAHQYNVTAPLGMTVIPTGPNNIVDPTGNTDDIVTCLSCHRAHASEHNDILRWDYDAIIAGGANSGGCFICHTDKNGT
ncbi:MAG: cytochrome c3 family protein [bacterium]